MIAYQRAQYGLYFAPSAGGTGDITGWAFTTIIDPQTYSDDLAAIEANGGVIPADVAQRWAAAILGAWTNEGPNNPPLPPPTFPNWGG